MSKQHNDADSRIWYDKEIVQRNVALTQELADKWKSSLPTIEAIEAKLNEEDEEIHKEKQRQEMQK